MSHAALAQSDLAVLLVIDMQERMMAALSDASEVTAAAVRMIRAAAILGIPVFHTEQNPNGLGRTIDAVREALPAGLSPIEKVTCSCWGDRGVRDRLGELGREHVLLVGVESHVCVQQTAIDLLRVDYEPFVLADAAGSRRREEKELALARLRAAGATVTSVEAMIFELVARCDASTFRDVLALVK
ncbi:MAG: isochorismatase family protein [Phycisphaerae bacterium]|nr:isochorismatase family protein [Phycisphaerae bacterium]